MKVFKIFMVATLMSLPFGCATKRKTKEVERIETIAENKVKIDSVASAHFKMNRNQSDLSVIEFESILKALNVQYDGEQGNDLKVSLNRTDNGTELNVSGKGKANYNEVTENTRSLTRNEIASIFDSIIDARVEQYNSESSEQLVDHFESDTTKEKTDISIWIYVVIGLVLVVGTAIYVAIKQLKGGK